MRWFKKDPLLHGILIFLTPVFIGLFVSLFVYSFIQLFDPNYEEFGPVIALYKSRDCIELDKPYFSASENCLGYARSISMYKDNPPSLDEGIKIAVEGVAKRFERSNFNPLDPLQWSCSVEGRAISDIQEKVQDKKTYKCWPR